MWSHCSVVLCLWCFLDSEGCFVFALGASAHACRHMVPNTRLRREGWLREIRICWRNSLLSAWFPKRPSSLQLLRDNATTVRASFVVWHVTNFHLSCVACANARSSRSDASKIYTGAVSGLAMHSAWSNKPVSQSLGASPNFTEDFS